MADLPSGSVAINAQFFKAPDGSIYQYFNNTDRFILLYTASQVDEITYLLASIDYVDTELESLQAQIDTKANIDEITEDIIVSYGDPSLVGSVYTNLSLANKTVQIAYYDENGAQVPFITFNSVGEATLPLTPFVGFKTTIRGSTGSFDGLVNTDDLYDYLNLTKGFVDEVILPYDKSAIDFTSNSIGNTAYYMDGTVVNSGDTIVNFYVKAVAGATTVKIGFITISGTTGTIHYEVTKSISVGINAFSLAELAIPEPVLSLPQFYIGITSDTGVGLKINLTGGQTRVLTIATGQVGGIVAPSTPIWLELILATNKRFALDTYLETKEVSENIYSVSEPDQVVAIPFDKTNGNFNQNTIGGVKYGFDNIFFTPNKLVNFCLKSRNTGGITILFKVDTTGFGQFTQVHSYTTEISTVGIIKIPVADLGLPDLSAYSKIYVFAGNNETKIPSVIGFISNVGERVYWWSENALGVITPSTKLILVNMNFWLDVDGEPESIIKDVNTLKDINSENVNVKSKWYGKSCVTFGDSITQFDNRPFVSTQLEEGVLCRGYQTYMIDNLGCTIDNQGVSGWDMTQIQTVIKAYNFSNKDFCTITSGVNDDRNNIQPGTVLPIGGSFITTTYAGALQSSIEYILNDNPECKIYLITPMNGFALNAIGGTYLNGYYLSEDYINVMLAIGKLYAIPVCDWYHNCSINDINKTTYIGDKPSVLSYIHPNNKGYKLLGSFVSSFLRNN